MKTLRLNAVLVGILMAALAISSCKKEAAPAPAPIGNTGPKIDTDVYIAGIVTANNSNSVAAYWKNGVLTKIPVDTTTSSDATGIAVDGMDVYVSGEYFTSTKNIPAYWKINDKSETQLTLPDSTVDTDPVATSITVYNHTVYVTGGIRRHGGYSYPVYWQGTNQPIQLANNHFSLVNGIAANAGGVYSAGEVNNSVFGQAPAYWKGSIRQTVKGDTTLQGFMRSITLVGTDIYTAGHVISSNTNTYTATYWKNGDPTYITDGSNYRATSIAIKNNVVYTAGYETAANGNHVACYWKDKKLINLSDYTQNSTTTGIALIGNDVYVTGYIADSKGNETPVYWKNGVIKSLPGAGSYGSTSGIVIITHPH